MRCVAILWPLLAGAAVATVSVPVGGGTAGQDVAWGPDTRLTANLVGDSAYGGNQRRVVIAADGRIHVVWYQDNPSAGARRFQIFYKRFNPGSGWSEDTMLGSDLYQAGRSNRTPAIALDSTGMVHVAWVCGSDSAAPEAVYYNSCMPVGSGNGGWGAVSYLLSPAVPLLDRMSPTVAATPDGHVHAVWMEQQPSPQVSHFVYRELIGAVWQPAETLDLGNSEKRLPVLAAGSSNQLHLAWSARLAGNFQVYVRARTGGMWEPVYEFVSDDTTDQFYPHAACDPLTGMPHLVWQGTEYGELSSIVHAYYTGTVWLRDTVPPAVDLQQRWPQLAFTPDGTAHAVWTGLSVASPVDPQVRYSTRPPFGSWSAATDLTSVASAKERPAIAAGRDTTLAVVWVDARDGNAELYYKGGLPDRARDVGIGAIVAPVGPVDSGVVVNPAAVVHNWGLMPETFSARLTITGGYSQTVAYPGMLAPGASAQLAFPVWTALLRGPYLARCSLLLSGDENPANDTASASGDVRVSGWRARSPMPAEPSNKAPKDGASMTFHPADRMVYAAKGNKTSDFYMWNPVTDTWTPLESIPPGPRGRKPKKGSSACADRSRYLYLVKGNNTSEFYRFDIQSRHWESLPSVPLLPSGKAVKGGGDMAFAEGRYGPNVYLLKGYKNDFLRYDIARESWFVMPSAPSQANPKWPAGSWLAHDGQSTIYAHKAQVSELWTFDVFSDAWSTAPRPGIPIQNSSGRTKKAKDGSAGVFLEGFLLALKGGNTNEFYVLDVGGNTWRPLESLPYGPGGKRTRVKAGGDLTGYSGYDRPGVPVSLPAVKGGGCDEVWDYKTDKESLAEKRDGIARAGSQWPAGCLRVYPNPVAEGVVTVAYQLEQPGPAAVGVYDVGGRCVAGQRADRSGSGSLLIDTRRLSAGVYVVRFRAGPLAASRKLVVSR